MNPANFAIHFDNIKQEVFTENEGEDLVYLDDRIGDYIRKKNYDISGGGALPDLYSKDMNDFSRHFELICWVFPPSTKGKIRKIIRKYKKKLRRPLAPRRKKMISIKEGVFVVRFD